jgi:hypothetical protein
MKLSKKDRANGLAQLLPNSTFLSIEIIDPCDDKLIREFQALSYKYLKIDYPLHYLKMAKIRIFRDGDGIISGGYAIATKGALRSIATLEQKYLEPIKHFKIFEINCLWLKPKRKSGVASCQFWYQVSRDVSSYNEYDYLVFSYDYDKPKLVELYELARPIVIYRGEVKALEGMNSSAIESIQLCDHKKVRYLPLRAFPDFCKRLFFTKNSNEIYSSVWRF